MSDNPPTLPSLALAVFRHVAAEGGVWGLQVKKKGIVSVSEGLPHIFSKPTRWKGLLIKAGVRRSEV